MAKPIILILMKQVLIEINSLNFYTKIRENIFIFTEIYGINVVSGIQETLEVLGHSKNN